MKVVWVGPQRTVPKIGLCSVDHIIDSSACRLDEAQLMDLVRQGLAKHYTSKSGRRKCAEEE